MKFNIGESTDKALCVALQHEFLRCDDAFNDFAAAGRIMISTGETPRICYTTYNAYARFVHHLYEFLLGAIARDHRNTSKLLCDDADKYIGSEAQRILNKRRSAILNGTAPTWENHISAYPETIPAQFAREFRRVRNVALGHVGERRATLNLSEFYHRYHILLGLLYHDVRGWWGRLPNGFPDLQEITKFSVLIKEDPPRLNPAAPTC